MKVHIRHLGVLDKVDIDIKPLTIFIGPNNGGKTWLAYTLAGIFGAYGWIKYSRAYTDHDVQDSYPELDDAIQHVLTEGNAKIDVVRFATDYARTYINNVAKLAKRWMREYFSTGLVSFDSLMIRIDLLEKDLENLSKRALSLSWDRSLGSFLKAVKEPGKPDLFFYTSTGENISEKFPERSIRELIVASAFGILHDSFYIDAPTFPTERTALITLSFNESADKSQGQISSEVLQPRRRIIPSLRPLIVPVGNFLSMIRMVFLMGIQAEEERAKEAKSNEAIGRYISLAQILEKQVLNGNVNFSTPEPDPKRELLFHSGEQKPLEIPIASSMVKELAALVLYLRYLAEPGDWLIIDEPEMNLHPEAQAKLTELLAMLVNAGLRVLITTHSPYIVDHTANLMKAAERPDPEAIEEKFYLKDKSAFLSKADVSVHLVDKGEAENILDEDGIIHWGTFGTVSDRVSDIYFEISGE